MQRAIYLITSDEGSGTTLITLGLSQVIALKTPKIAYLKPIVNNKEPNQHIRTMLAQLKLNIPYEKTYLFTIEELIKYNSINQLEEVYTQIIARYKELESAYDFVIIEGLSPHPNISLFERVFNVSLAKNLNIPVCLILKDDIHLSEKDFIHNVHSKLDELLSKEINVIGLFINQCARKDNHHFKQALQNNFGKDRVIATIPFIPELNKPTLYEIQECLEAQVLYNEDKIKSIIPKNSVIGAMQLSHFLCRIHEQCLIIVPSDRSDLILGSLLANRSPNFPNIAGIILTGNIPLDKSIEKLLSQSPQNIIPILSVKTGTFSTATKISGIHTRIYPENTKKIQTCIKAFQKYTDIEALLEKITTFNSKEWITPKMFQYNILHLAKSYQSHIVLPEGDDDRVLTAATMIANDGIAYLTVLGEEQQILDRIHTLSLPWNKERIQIINPMKSPYLEEYAQTLYEARKHKGMDLIIARDTILDVSYFGTMMVHKGHASGMVSGAKHTTAHTIKPALQLIKTRPNCTTVSSVFFMLLDDRVLIYGDCAIVPNPNEKELAEIALSAAATATAFHIQPRMALLSYSSGGSGSGEDVDKVRKATTIVKDIIQKEGKDILVEGPIQYDAAVDKQVAISKMPQSKVAGRANVLIFPDLNTGNNTYKAVQRESKSIAIGPILQGLKKPVNDLSRGALVTDIYNTIIMTAIQAGSGI